MVFAACAAVFGLLALGGCLPQKGEPLRVVTDATFPPYEFLRGQDIVGIDIELVNTIAGKLGRPLRLENVDFESVIPAVISGKAEFAVSGLTITEDRRRNVDFSIPYVKTGLVIIYRKSMPVLTAEACRGKRLGVQGGSTSEHFILSHIKQEPDRFRSPPEAVAALKAGRVDLVIADIEPARNCIAGEDDLAISDFVSTEEYAIAVRKGNPELVEQINEIIREVQADGRMAKWVETYTSGERATADGGWRDEFFHCFVKDGRYAYLLNGLGVTLQVALAAIVLGLFLGFIVAMIRSTHDKYGSFPILNLVSRAYLAVIRGTPLVVQLLITYYIILKSVDSKVLIAILAFGVNSGAYQAEIIRAGIASVDSGQMEAGRALGLSYWRTMLRVILPQAVRNVLPALGNEFIVLIKDTAIVGYIALVDLAKGGDIIRSQTYSVYVPYLTVALVYFVLISFFTWLLGRLERHLRATGASPVPKDS